MRVAAILLTCLNDRAAAVMAGDFLACRSRVVAPFHLMTHRESLSLSTDDDLREGFDSFCALLKSQRVTDFIRLVGGAQLLDPGLIKGRFITHVIAGAMRFIDPFPSQMTLRRVDGRWRATSVTNALAKSRWPLLMASPAKTDLRKGPEE